MVIVYALGINMTHPQVRSAAVAGQFYPQDAAQLQQLINQQLATTPAQGDSPKALIIPHAGYVYSGTTAASAYQRLAKHRHKINQVILLGPSHHHAFEGIALSSAQYFATPLGDIPVAEAAQLRLSDLPFVHTIDAAHEREHSLEVHLPFLQQVLGHFRLVPMVLGQVSPSQVATVLEHYWQDEDSVIIVSSDLSHYQAYEKAQTIDRNTSVAIETLSTQITPEQACGCRGINGLLELAQNKGLFAQTIAIRNSGDTAGDKQRVVGYGSYAIAGISTTGKQRLLQLARNSIEHGLAGNGLLDIKGLALPAYLQTQAASFVTLNLHNQLRGCIGTLQAHKPLVQDVLHNAHAAAFNDPRFKPLSKDEAAHVELHISILSKASQVKLNSRQALLDFLQVGKHGLILKDGNHQATYLPSVWQQISDPDQFVGELRRKAGLSFDGWSDTMQVFCYTVEEFA